MTDIRDVAAGADIIVNGYAFTKSDAGIRILNLNRPERAAVFSEKGDMLETSMDDIELSIVKDYFLKNREFMET